MAGTHVEIFDLRCWSKFTPMLVSPRRPCPSWTPSSMISLRELLEKLLVSLPTTSRRQSLPGQSRLLAVWSFLESLPSTPFLREPRLSPSTPAASRSLQERLFKQPAIFIATKLVKELLKLSHLLTKICYSSGYYHGTRNLVCFSWVDSQGALESWSTPFFGWRKGSNRNLTRVGRSLSFFWNQNWCQFPKNWTDPN